MSMRSWVVCPLLIPILATLAFNPFSLASAALAQGRLISRSDTLRIRVINQPDLENELRVAPDGTINFPYVGRFRVVGSSEDQVGRRIAQALDKAEVVKKAQVLVTVVSFGTQITVIGGVRNPGSFQLDRPTTLTEALGRAGGLTSPNGSTVVVRRRAPNGIAVERLPAKTVVAGKVDGENPSVADGDEIYVEEAPVYYLYGYVGRPGAYPLTRPVTVQQALAAGGGITELGSDWRIDVKRRVPDGTIVTERIGLDDSVLANDTIVVNERIF
ncbi:hypothetical protein ES708_03227 [subsurface metagenome]